MDARVARQTRIYEALERPVEMQDERAEEHVRVQENKEIKVRPRQLLQQQKVVLSTSNSQVKVWPSETVNTQHATMQPSIIAQIQSKVTALVGAFRREKEKDTALQALAAENQATMQLELTLQLKKGILHEASFPFSKNLS
ncbi:hypothetical protein JRO89_XS05G0047000 [Xanthoceras sorbifolium]|uniref:Uncharacterized protein n=1 Tax=Xanthoceras sorbifolium TaxID=99658 RepID=A0ABQ8I0J0_9ROSI|nr:hypothetical protein JRO89_XS05G0047000 [Xanthoceras sorbifolium]